MQSSRQNALLKGETARVTAGEEFDFLEKVGDCIRLKRNHRYYAQIVGQMKLAQKTHGYFIVYTFKDFFYEKIPCDNSFFDNTLLPKLQHFYDKVYCPYVASKL